MESNRAFSAVSTSSSGAGFGMASERTESFMANMELLNADMAALDSALKALDADIRAYGDAKEAEAEEWGEREAEWLAELDELRLATAATGVADDDDDVAETQYWTTSREWRSIVYGGCYLHDHNAACGNGGNGNAEGNANGHAASASPPLGKAKGGGFNSIEAILEQRNFKGTLYYRVKWAGADVVSWEEAAELKAIGAIGHAAASMVCSRKTSQKALRPAVYIPRRTPAAAGRCRTSGAGYPGVWSCEVEPMVWVPYDSDVQGAIEKAFLSSNPTAAITINGAHYTIDFGNMAQHGGRAARNVRRSEQLPPAVLRRRVNDMTVAELREYLLTVEEFTDIHYEALARLHEEDKVRSHLSKTEMAALPTLSFAELLENICGGAEYSAFSTECSICLEDYKGTDVLVCMPSCGHFFHRACAVQYFSRFSKLCPYCKEPAV